MLSTDREEFNAQMAILCAGHNVPPRDATLEAFWKSFAPLGLIEFARCVDFAVSLEGPDKMPSTHVLWDIRTKLKNRRPQTFDVIAKAAPESPWLRHVNGFFVQYLCRRRVTEGFTGDLHLLERRSECRRLAHWFEELAAEADPEATEASLKLHFERLMARMDAPPILTPQLLPEEA